MLVIAIHLADSVAATRIISIMKHFAFLLSNKTTPNMGNGKPLPSYAQRGNHAHGITITCIARVSMAPGNQANKTRRGNHAHASVSMSPTIIHNRNSSGFGFCSGEDIDPDGEAEEDEEKAFFA